jgi:hypothetical protein
MRNYVEDAARVFAANAGLPPAKVKHGTGSNPENTKAAAKVLASSTGRTLETRSCSKDG